MSARRSAADPVAVALGQPMLVLDHERFDDPAITLASVNQIGVLSIAANRHASLLSVEVIRLHSNPSSPFVSRYIALCPSLVPPPRAFQLTTTGARLPDTHTTRLSTWGAGSRAPAARENPARAGRDGLQLQNNIL